MSVFQLFTFVPIISSGENKSEVLLKINTFMGFSINLPDLYLFNSNTASEEKD